MSKTQVTNLIKALPAGLTGEYCIQERIDAARKVLTVYREAEQYDLSERDKQILKIRLMDTARILAKYVDLPGYRSKRMRQQAAQYLFMEFAEALNMDPQELQVATM